MAAIGLLMTGLTGIHSAAAQQQPTGALGGVPASRPERGAVFDGLERDARRCRDGYKVRATTLCTHGPDQTPPGTDVRKTSAPVTNATTSQAPGNPAAAGMARCDGDGTSGKRTQVLYARASDRPDRFTSYVASFRVWAAQASVEYEDSAAEQGTLQTRSIRFVHDPSCTITVTSAVLQPSGDDNFSNTISGLRNLGFNRTDRKYMVFVDAAVYCGIGNVYLDDQPGSANPNSGGPSYGRVDTACWSGPVVAHEHMHNLGGVQRSAPHATSAFHCTDEYDRMCYQDAADTQLQVVCNDPRRDTLFDCNHDDYFSVNPPAGGYLATHLNAANSPYLLAGSLASSCNGLTPTMASAGTINGTPGDDVILGSPGPNIIDGKGGNDTICGLDGDDTLIGGSGNDVLNGGEGDDDLRAVDGVVANDRTDGAAGRDVCAGDAGDVRVSCGGTLGDYDGDAKTDLSVWRSGPGTWWVRRSTDDSATDQDWGSAALGDVPVPADYDGDGTTDLAVWRSGPGVWWVRKSSDGSTTNQAWGGASLGDVPVPGDYDGDGKADLAVWRSGPGVWYVLNSSDGSTTNQAWGGASLGDVPVPGDYDGDAKTDLAVWRSGPGTWWVRKSSDGSFTNQAWGSASLGDVAVPGDYDGDAKTDLAVWRSGPGVWWVVRSADGSTTNQAWGSSSLGDVPVTSTGPQSPGP